MATDDTEYKMLDLLTKLYYEGNFVISGLGNLAT